MTLRTRLVASIAGIAVLVVLPALYGASRLARLRDIAEDLHARHAVAFLALARLQGSLADVDRNERSYVAAPSPQAHDGMTQALARARAELRRLDEVGYHSATRGTRGRMDALQIDIANIASLVQAHRAEDATRLFDAAKPNLRAIQDSLEVIATDIDRRSAADVVKAQEISAAATT